MTDATFDERINDMLANGKLTDEEAARLRKSLNDQAGRDAPLQSARGPSSRRGRLAPLLLLLVFAFALGALTTWLTSPGPDAAQPVAAVAGQAPDAGRPIDLRILDQERSTTMQRSLPLFATLVPLVVLVVLGALVALLYNGLINSREQVNAGWAQVENVYQRRLDLVPVLVDTVQTYTEHERETLTELAQARAQALRTTGMLVGAPDTAEQLRAIEMSQGQVETALARLLAVVENYPDLKASRNFATLQDQLEGTENRVAMERRSYNEFSRRYNTRLQTFPSNLVADMMGFESKPYFQAEERAMQAPDDPFGRREG